MIAFDTNVLVYAIDSANPPRHALANRLLADVISRGEALFSLQVLAEFCNVSTRKFGLAPTKAEEFVLAWSGSGTIEGFTDADLAAAMSAWARHKLTIWDALIWATCDRVGATILATEDLQDGRALGRVTFLNPFNPANASRLGLA